MAFSGLDSDLANFMIGQDGGEYQSRLRTSETGNKGRPRRLKTFDAAVTDQLTHLVYTFDGTSGEAAFWVDAQEWELEVGQSSASSRSGPTAAVWSRREHRLQLAKLVPLVYDELRKLAATTVVHLGK